VSSPVVIHRSEALDSPPAVVREELDGAREIGCDWKSEEEVEIFGMNRILPELDLESELSCEDEFVTLKEPSRRVLPDGKGNGINEVLNPFPNFRGMGRVLDCILKDGTESLEGELVNGVDHVEVIKDEVEERGSDGSRSVLEAQE
jgi:hypothetical protein